VPIIRQVHTHTHTHTPRYVYTRYIQDLLRRMYEWMNGCLTLHHITFPVCLVMNVTNGSYSINHSIESISDLQIRLPRPRMRVGRVRHCVLVFREGFVFGHGGHPLVERILTHNLHAQHRRESLSRAHSMSARHEDHTLCTMNTVTGSSWASSCALGEGHS